MSAYVYILTDGLHSKIGITSDLLKRFSYYVTHNPNFQIYKTYQCDRIEARRIESHIKKVFKSKLSGQSTEWFKVEAEYIDRYVCNIIFPPIRDQVTPGTHGAPLTEAAIELKGQIKEILNCRPMGNRNEIGGLQDMLAELFALAFNVGIPEHKLPEHVLHIDPLTIDFQNCNPCADIVKNIIRKNQVHVPHDDHIKNFYHIIRLRSGYFVAVCTARVSMPYLASIKGKELEITNAAKALGWSATFHEAWSWHYPDQTALVLFQQKTKISVFLNAWENSFRKWVIERSNLIRYEYAVDHNNLARAIEDTVNDFTLPLGISSYQEFLKSYIEIYWEEMNESFFLKDAYSLLFEMWLKFNQNEVVEG